MICIYHDRDFDGFCSAAIVKLKYPDATFIGWDYGKPIPELSEHEPVIMVDVSFPMEVMETVARKAGSLIWIDHHKSAINDWEQYTEDGETFCNAYLDSSIAACEATWKVFFKDKLTPQAVGLLGIYDTWRMKDDPIWDEKIMPFQMGMKSLCNSLDNFPSYLLDEEYINEEGRDVDFVVNEIIANGKGILKYQKMANVARCNNSAFEREFEGLRAICLVGVIGSGSFESMWDHDKYDIMIAASFMNGKWTISLYSDKPEIDCSVICKKHGGGGHKGAAGFVTDDISFLTNK